MRRRIPEVGSGLLVGAGAPSVPPSLDEALFREIILAANPTLYWALDALTGLEDLTANNRDGSGQGSPTIGGSAEDPLGDGSGVTTLNGSSQSIDRAEDVWPASPGPLTLVALARRTSNVGDRTFFGGLGTTYPRLATLNGGNDIGWNFRHTGASATWTGAWPHGTSGWGLIGLEATQFASSALYIDGVLVSSLALNDNYSSSATGLSVGRAGGSNGPWAGQLGHFALIPGAMGADFHEELFAATELG